MRNYAVGGGFYLTTSQFGPNFFIGNNPQADGTYMSLRSGAARRSTNARTRPSWRSTRSAGRLTPAEVSSYWTDRALDFITGQAGRVAEARRTQGAAALERHRDGRHREHRRAMPSGRGRFGSADGSGTSACSYRSPFVGLVLSWDQRSRLAVLYAMLAAYAASVIMFYVFARYRLPLVPLLLLFAVRGAAALPGWAARAATPAKAWQQQHLIQRRWPPATS